MSNCPICGGIQGPHNSVLPGCECTYQTTMSPIRPKYEVTFHDGNREVGRLDFNGGVLKFKGNAEESARVFINFLAERFADRLKEEREACAEICDRLERRYGYGPEWARWVAARAAARAAEVEAEVADAVDWIKRSEEQK